MSKLFGSVDFPASKAALEGRKPFGASLASVDFLSTANRIVSGRVEGPSIFHFRNPTQFNGDPLRIKRERRLMADVPSVHVTLTRE
jgi:hypothetical protein